MVMFNLYDVEDIKCQPRLNLGAVFFPNTPKTKEFYTQENNIASQNLWKKVYIATRRQTNF